MATKELTLPGGNRGLLLLALAAGLVAAVVVFIVLNESDSGGGGSTASGATAPVLVAAQNIPVGTEITEDMVKVADVPENLVVTGAFSNSQPAVGQVSRITIAQGEQMTSAKIGVPVPDKGLAGVVPAGKRAVALDVSEVTAVGGLLLPGDHVDIVAAYTVDNAPGLAEGDSLLRTQTILQNVEVLSVAQEAQKPSARANQDTSGADANYTSGQLPSDVQEQPDAGTLTLALDPGQALVLISYQQHADKVWAMLRPYGDQSVGDVQPYDVVISGD